MRRLWITMVLAGALIVPAVAARAQTLTCNGLPVTIRGTAGNDPITGTGGADVIAALGGNDTMSGLGGDDTACLGPGIDAFQGGSGNDTLVAEAGADGPDNFSGGTGADGATYQVRTVAVNVTLDGAANDGSSEGDNIRVDVENVTGARSATAPRRWPAEPGPTPTSTRCSASSTTRWRCSGETSASPTCCVNVPTTPASAASPSCVEPASTCATT
jgi:RTX calcium-binding nonapeptide repeat (4 copies)